MDPHASNKHMLSEVEFKTTYIATFLATYMANRYLEDCQSGHVGEPYKFQPVEDANFNANCAWQRIQEYL